MDVQTLQQRLARHEPVALYDIRRASDHREWTIPGAESLDTYDQIWSGDYSLLDQVDFPDDRPVVLFCAVGETSQKAARYLTERGQKVESLAGGMRAWNHAWNHAERSLDDGLTLHQVRRTGKGCLSYLLVSGPEALVIDADVDPRTYIDMAERMGVQIVGALDTHLHADHLSRSHLVARHLGVPYHMHRAARLSFPHRPLDDGDQIAVGDHHIEILSTPGHTWDSVTYRVGARAILTGDTLFTDGVGRPDLGAGKAEVRDRAEALYASVQRLMGLPDDTEVLPAHASRPLPFDDAQWSAKVRDLHANAPLLKMDEDRFVDHVLANTPDVPSTYMRIVALNRQGLFPEDEVDELEAGANRCAASAA